MLKSVSKVGEILARLKLTRNIWSKVRKSWNLFFLPEAANWNFISALKTFRIKTKLAKKLKQNCPIYNWIRMRTGNTIRRHLAKQNWSCNLGIMTQHWIKHSQTKFLQIKARKSTTVNLLLKLKVRRLIGVKFLW